MSSYINDGHRHRDFLDEPHCWRLFTWGRLAWQYGEDRADRIMIGNDPATQADIARWNALGRRSAA